MMNYGKVGEFLKFPFIPFQLRLHQDLLQLTLLGNERLLIMRIKEAEVATCPVPFMNTYLLAS